ncbi:MAG: hypothetical protein P1U63_11785 [Coxiellaceae bacterium]|nr:hypothetical protein [Coxiellaceae bacterium]
MGFALIIVVASVMIASFDRIFGSSVIKIENVILVRSEHMREIKNEGGDREGLEQDQTAEVAASNYKLLEDIQLQLRRLPDIDALRFESTYRDVCDWIWMAAKQLPLLTVQDKKIDFSSLACGPGFLQYAIDNIEVPLQIEYLQQYTVAQQHQRPAIEMVNHIQTIRKNLLTDIDGYCHPFFAFEKYRSCLKMAQMDKLYNKIKQLTHPMSCLQYAEALNNGIVEAWNALNKLEQDVEGIQPGTAEKILKKYHSLLHTQLKEIDNQHLIALFFSSQSGLSQSKLDRIRYAVNTKIFNGSAMDVLQNKVRSYKPKLLNSNGNNPEYKMPETEEGHQSITFKLNAFFQKNINSIVSIQSAIRAYNARKLFRQLKYQPAAKVIQPIVRGYLARQQLSKLRYLKSFSGNQQAEHASKKIQFVWRKYADIKRWREINQAGEVGGVHGILQAYRQHIGVTPDKDIPVKKDEGGNTWLAPRTVKLKSPYGNPPKSPPKSPPGSETLSTSYDERLKGMWGSFTPTSTPSNTPRNSDIEDGISSASSSVRSDTRPAEIGNVTSSRSLRMFSEVDPEATKADTSLRPQSAARAIPGKNGRARSPYRQN